MAEPQCLNCRNWRIDGPPGWKPTNYQREYSLWNLRHHLGEYPQWKDGWPGKCRLQPSRVETRSIDWCSHWRVNEEFLQDWHHLSELGSLWQQVQKLKAELKAAQKLSLERHHRLRAQSAKTKTVT